MCMPSRRQGSLGDVGPRGGGDPFQGGVDPLRAATVQTVQRFSHPAADQGAHIVGLGLFEEFRDVGRGDRVVVEAGFDPFQADGGQHQQPWDEGHEQPRHKVQVNTGKVSVGSRISTLS